MHIFLCLCTDFAIIGVHIYHGLYLNSLWSTSLIFFIYGIKCRNWRCLPDNNLHWRSFISRFCNYCSFLVPNADGLFSHYDHNSNFRGLLSCQKHSLFAAVSHPVFLLLLDRMNISLTCCSIQFLSYIWHHNN